MFYVVEAIYIGGNQEDIDCDYIAIFQNPLYIGGVEYIDSDSNPPSCADYSYHPQGEFDTLAEAKKYIDDNYEYREYSDDEDKLDDDCVFYARLGKHTPMPVQDATNEMLNGFDFAGQKIIEMTGDEIKKEVYAYHKALEDEKDITDIEGYAYTFDSEAVIEGLLKIQQEQKARENEENEIFDMYFNPKDIGFSL